MAVYMAMVQMAAYVPHDPLPAAGRAPLHGRVGSDVARRLREDRHDCHRNLRRPIVLV